MKIKLQLTGLMVLFGALQPLFSQDCLEKLYSADKLLTLGKADACLNQVRSCSFAGNDESIRSQAYRLMSISYLLKGSSDSAKIAAENMLGINPTYKPNLLKDPADFISLLNSIVVIPKFSLGLAISAGTNTTFTSISRSYVVADYNKTYSALSGLQFGTNLGFYLSPKWMLELGIIAASKKYEINYAFTNWKVSVKERLSYVDMPLTVKYLMRTNKKLRIFASGGIYTGYLLYDQNDFKSTYTPTNQEYQLNRLNAISRRYKWNSGVTGGLGLYYKLNQGHVSIQANYFQSLTSITRADKRYSYPEQIYTYYYVDDDIKLNNLALSVGYTYYLNYKVYRSKK